MLTEHGSNLDSTDLHTGVKHNLAVFNWRCIEKNEHKMKRISISDTPHELRAKCVRVIVKLSLYGPTQAPRAREGWGPQDFQTAGTWKCEGRQPYAPAAFTSQERSLVLISVPRLSRLQGHNVKGRIKSMKNHKDNVRNQTRDPPACCAIPQPAALPLILSVTVQGLHNLS
jgi:hypothetical protein